MEIIIKGIDEIRPYENNPRVNDGAVGAVAESIREFGFQQPIVVHQYDVVLVSLTSECDWWSYIAERQRWRKGDYKVLIGGAGVLHVVPFLRWFYAVMFGRGENLIVPLVQSIERGERWHRDSVLYADEFSYDRIWRIEQTETAYQHALRLDEKQNFVEKEIGCNHRCLF